MFAWMAVGFVEAGELNPPAGAITATMKPLHQVEPRIAINATNTPAGGGGLYRITQPGSYYLTGNVSLIASQDGIVVSADGVTIDLNGFELVGTGSSNSGISTGSSKGCTVRNGTVRGWGHYGLQMSGSGHRLEGITVSQNTTAGIFLGNDSQVSACTMQLNLGHGISMGSNCSIRHSVASQNGTQGTHYGISAGHRCLVTGCVANQNFGAGIRVNHGGRVVDCQASNNGNGIITFTNGLVSGAMCQLKDSDGVNAGNGTTVRDSMCDSNGDDGIQVASDCVVVNNTCSDNGPSASGAGVYVVGNVTQIENNRLTNNRYGILTPASSTNNFIVRNAARNNLGANFSVSAGNDLAPVITNPDSTFSGATPWSNFAY